MRLLPTAVLPLVWTAEPAGVPAADVVTNDLVEGINAFDQAKAKAKAWKP